MDKDSKLLAEAYKQVISEDENADPRILKPAKVFSRLTYASAPWEWAEAIEDAAQRLAGLMPRNETSGKYNSILEQIYHTLGQIVDDVDSEPLPSFSQNQQPEYTRGDTNLGPQG